MTGRQPGSEQEIIPLPSIAKSACGEPPPASTRKTRDQPEKAADSIQPPPCGNCNSTGRSPVPRQAARGLRNDKQHKPHLVAPTATDGARTKHLVRARTGQPHPAANLPSSCCAGAAVHQCSHGTQPDCRISAWARAPLSLASRAAVRLAPRSLPTGRRTCSTGSDHAVHRTRHHRDWPADSDPSG
jgi:hypothetical protein